MKKKYRGADLDKILSDIDFPALKKEIQQQVTRQKQRFAVNTMVEEYEVTITVDIKKVRKR
ncbi:MAG: hypothetical protein N3A54_00705 [Patescibacteria group bacterium]|nr:hypothetical protein [Patescibacteria group bacterium]